METAHNPSCTQQNMTVYGHVVLAPHRTVPAAGPREVQRHRAHGPLGYRLVEKLPWTAGTAPRVPSGFLGQKYFGVTTIYKEGTPSVHRGWRRPPRGAGPLPQRGDCSSSVMENHSAIRGLKISHRGACALPLDLLARVQEGPRPAVPSRPTRRSCGRGARVLPGQPGPQRLRSAFTAPDPAPNDERMAA